KEAEQAHLRERIDLSGLMLLHDSVKEIRAQNPNVTSQEDLREKLRQTAGDHVAGLYDEVRKDEVRQMFGLGPGEDLLDRMSSAEDYYRRKVARAYASADQIIRQSPEGGVLAASLDASFPGNPDPQTRKEGTGVRELISRYATGGDQVKEV